MKGEDRLESLHTQVLKPLLGPRPHRVFEELADYRAFELLRNQTMRGDYLLTKQVPSYLRLLRFPGLGCRNRGRGSGSCDLEA